MASTSVSLFFMASIGLMVLSASAISIKPQPQPQSRKCPTMCCQTINIKGTSQFVEDSVAGQNEFSVVPNDSDERPGSQQTFSATFTTTTGDNGNYTGVISNVGAGDIRYQNALVSFDSGSYAGSIVTFDGLANTAPGSVVTYAVTGGTQRFAGVTTGSSVTETSLGNSQYQLQLKLIVEVAC